MTEEHHRGPAGPGLDRLRTVLEAYGAAPERWPGPERAALLALLERSADARRLQAEAAALDRWLDSQPEPDASPDLLAAVLGAADRPNGPRLLSVLWPFGPVWQPACALVFVALLGIGTGQELSPTVSSAQGTDFTEDYAALALGTPYDYVVPE